MRLIYVCDVSVEEEFTGNSRKTVSQKPKHQSVKLLLNFDKKTLKYFKLNLKQFVCEESQCEHQTVRPTKKTQKVFLITIIKMYILH